MFWNAFGYSSFLKTTCNMKSFVASHIFIESILEYDIVMVEPFIPAITIQYYICYNGWF